MDLKENFLPIFLNCRTLIQAGGPQLFRITSMALEISRNHCWNQRITSRFLVSGIIIATQI